jgi:hypothetical protein
MRRAAGIAFPNYSRDQTDEFGAATLQRMTVEPPSGGVRRKAKSKIKSKTWNASSNRRVTRRGGRVAYCHGQ